MSVGCGHPVKARAATATRVTRQLAQHITRCPVKKANASAVRHELNAVSNLRQVMRPRLRSELVIACAHVNERFAAEWFHEVDRGIEGCVVGRNRALAPQPQMLRSNTEHEIARSACSGRERSRKGDRRRATLGHESRNTIAR